MAEKILYPHEFLPLPEQNGYGFEPVSPMARSTYTSGRSRSRKLYSNVPTQCSITLLFANDGETDSDGQARLFDQWGKVTLSEWTSWFYMQLKTPLGINYHKCRFIDIPKGPLLSGVMDWYYTATLELYERPIMPGDIGAYNPWIVAHADRFDILINSVWPEEII